MRGQDRLQGGHRRDRLTGQVHDDVAGLARLRVRFR
jgi:hypothetical protein